jgi:hypothetical protein
LGWNAIQAGSTPGQLKELVVLAVDQGSEVRLESVSVSSQPTEAITLPTGIAEPVRSPTFRPRNAPTLEETDAPALPFEATRNDTSPVDPSSEDPFAQANPALHDPFAAPEPRDFPLNESPRGTRQPVPPSEDSFGLEPEPDVEVEWVPETIYVPGPNGLQTPVTRMVPVPKSPATNGFDAPPTEIDMTTPADALQVVREPIKQQLRAEFERKLGQLTAEELRAELKSLQGEVRELQARQRLETIRRELTAIQQELPETLPAAAARQMLSIEVPRAKFLKTFAPASEDATPTWLNSSESGADPRDHSRGLKSFKPVNEPEWDAPSFEPPPAQ